jgi:hypothetical protein
VSWFSQSRFAGEYGTEEASPFLKKEDSTPNVIANEIEL